MKTFSSFFKYFFLFSWFLFDAFVFSLFPHTLNFITSTLFFKWIARPEIAVIMSTHALKKKNRKKIKERKTMEDELFRHIFDDICIYIYVELFLLFID